jgi:hypothetical protein
VDDQAYERGIERTIRQGRLLTIFRLECHVCRLDLSFREVEHALGNVCR